ncbi:MAG: acylphosphatase [Deltaproteobacteria bacterium]|nr:acylphosphatase [Deltaproteobacteria bacterium]MBW2520448.1 acylphosphatase [Deltaproteobacteria bacterium]
MKVRAKVTVEGLVQGVFFRQSTCEMAAQIGVSGWVRNRQDGQVEAIFEGEKNLVEKALAWCQSGPPAAQVTNIEVEWENFRGEFDGFLVRY